MSLHTTVEGLVQAMAALDVKIEPSEFGGLHGPDFATDYDYYMMSTSNGPRQFGLSPSMKSWKALRASFSSSVASRPKRSATC